MGSGNLRLKVPVLSCFTGRPAESRARRRLVSVDNFILWRVAGKRKLAGMGPLMETLRPRPYKQTVTSSDGSTVWGQKAQ